MKIKLDRADMSTYDGKLQFSKHSHSVVYTVLMLADIYSIIWLVRGITLLHNALNTQKVILSNHVLQIAQNGVVIALVIFLVLLIAAMLYCLFIFRGLTKASQKAAQLVCDKFLKETEGARGVLVTNQRADLGDKNEDSGAN